MNQLVVTIGREHGSGGRTIGKIVAQRLGVPFLDHQIVYRAARESGLSPDYIKDYERTRKTGSLFFDMLAPAAVALPLDDQVYLAERDVIEKAAQSPCVIVGRCADYILRDHKHCLRVFVHAPLEERVKRCVEEYRDDAGSDPTAYVQKMDKRRAAYYQSITGQKWGDARNYDLCVSTRNGLVRVADWIAYACAQLGGQA